MPDVEHMNPGLLYKIVILLVTVVCKVFFRLKIQDAENLPSQGGVLIACSHQSFLDPIVVAIGTGKRPVAFMARDTLFKNWAFGWFISHLNAFPVHRGAADRDAIREAVKRLRAGNALLIFPEGRRSDDGRVGELQSGSAMLAYWGKVPIVPAVIKGAFEAWPRSRKLPRPHRISITFGPAIPPPAAGDRETSEKVRVELQRRLEELMGQQRLKAEGFELRTLNFEL